MFDWPWPLFWLLSDEPQKVSVGDGEVERNPRREVRPSEPRWSGKESLLIIYFSDVPKSEHLVRLLELSLSSESSSPRGRFIEFELELDDDVQVYSPLGRLLAVPGMIEEVEECTEGDETEDKSDSADSTSMVRLIVPANGMKR